MPPFLKIQAGSGSPDVDPDSVLEDRDFIRQEFIGGNERCRAEFSLQEGVQQFPRIFGSCFDQNIKIKSSSRHAVENGGDASDYQILDIIFLQ